MDFKGLNSHHSQQNCPPVSVSHLNICFNTEGATVAQLSFISSETQHTLLNYEGHLESKECFAIKKYLLIIGKKKNMQVLSHTFTYFST